MKSTEETISTSDQRKNILTTALAGACWGLLGSYGFEFGLGVGVLGGALFGAAIGFRINRRPPKMRFPMALLRRMLIAAAILLLLSFGYSYLLDQNLSQSQQLWSAALPLLGWTALVISIGMAIGSLDELQRRIQTEAIAIAFGVTAIFVGGYAVFQFAGLAEVNVGLVLLVMSFAWLAGKLWTMWKYQ